MVATCARHEIAGDITELQDLIAGHGQGGQQRNSYCARSRVRRDGDAPQRVDVPDRHPEDLGAERLGGRGHRIVPRGRVGRPGLLQHDDGRVQAQDRGFDVKWLAASADAGMQVHARDHDIRHATQLP
jgi:hypothetical protein